MKKLMSVVIAICLICSGLPATAYAQQQTPISIVANEISEQETVEASVSGGDAVLCEPLMLEVVEPDALTAEVVEPDALTAEVVEPDALTAEVVEPDALTAEADEPDALTATGEITRIQWLQALTGTFGMTVEEDNYPDNYYSDIDSASEYYYDVMLATEFGLIDVEAGEALRPDDLATREFAAHTLNLCLGYSWEEGDTYTFSEAEEVTYPDDIQVAIEHGWFQLVDGAFLPEQAITAAEQTIMLTEAEEAQEAIAIDTAYNSTYEFLDNVIVLPETTGATMTNENELTLTDCTTELAVGDVFGIVSNGLPVAYKILSFVEKEEVAENELVVQIESVPTKDAFKSIDVQGDSDVDLAEVKAFNDTLELQYIVGGTIEEEWEDGVKYDSLEAVGEQEISAIEVVQSYEIPDSLKKKYELSDSITADITAKISNVKVKHKVTSKKAYFKVDAEITYTCNVSIDLLEEMEIAPSVDLFYVPIGGVGYAKLSLDLSFEGELTLSLVQKLSAGVYYEYGKGFRAVTDFKKKSFTIQAQVQLSAGVKFTIGINCGVIEGKVYGKVGGAARVERFIYDDGNTPETCLHTAAWLYASVGYKVEVHLLITDLEWGDEFVIFDEKNSPVRVCYHYEDGVAVSACTRDGDGNDEDDGSGSGTTTKKYKYYTPADSKYGYNGASTGVSSSGEPYTIFEYDLDDDLNATITSYQGNVSALSIPSTLDGYKVIGIKNGVFRDNMQLRMVIIPDTVTTIGVEAFENCANLSQVTLSKNVTSIGYRAFGNCDALLSIEIPKSLDTTTTWATAAYGAGVFSECDNLKEVTFEEGVTQIANYLFAYCTGLEKIEIQDTITVIEDNAFRGCSNLSEVIMSDSVTSLGTCAFLDCDKLAGIELSASVTSIGNSAFNDCDGLLEIVIPDSVVSIGVEAFEDCEKLSKITLSKGVTSIGYRAFGNCDALTSIDIPKSLDTTTIWASAAYGAGVFSECDNLKKVTFEEGTKQIASYLFAYCTGLEKIEIPDTITVIEDNAFRGCSNLSEVIMSDSVTSIETCAFLDCDKLAGIELSASVINIGNSAFNDCDGLLEIVIPDSVVSIGVEVFEDCEKLSKVTLSKRVTSIGYRAFGNCDALTSVEIPKSLDTTTTWATASYGAGVFSECDNLKEVTFEEGTTQIANWLFAYCTGLEQIEIPATVTVIEDNAFRGCSNLSEVIMTEGITSIKNSAFYECVKIAEISIPDSVTDMGTYIFSGCSGLTKVKLPYGSSNISKGTFQDCVNLTAIELPETVTAIRQDAFNNTGLTEINIPDKVTIIEESAFEGCTSLTKAICGRGITSIGQYAFMNCTALAEVTFGDKLTKIGNQAFRNCEALATIVVPDSVTSLGTYVFADCDALSDVTLGTGITTIPAYTFNLCPALQKIVIPYRVTTIKDNAFTNCTGLTEVTIPRATDTIGSSVFSYPTRMTIYGISGTYAEEYAETIGATFVNKEVNATSLTLSATEITINKGDTANIIMTITPADFTDEVSWRCTDTSIVTVSDTGVITAKALGTATIRVTVGELSASCKVTVKQPVTSISLSKTSISMEALDTATLTATVYPSTAENKDIVWSSSDETVATVDQNGNVTALTKGTATITVTAQDGSEVSKNCTVTVTNNAYKCVVFTELESEHDYANNCTDKWIYTSAGAANLQVTFDAQTYIEDEFDWLYIYDGSGNQVGKYTGNQLASQTVDVPGDTVVIQLQTDEAGDAWGFKVTNVKEIEQIIKLGDVDETSWQYAPAKYVYEKGIMTGKGFDVNGDVIFAPNDKLTREQFAQVLYSAEGKEAVTYTTRFTDVADGQWYTSAVLWAADKGIVSGMGEGIFGVGANITREQLALMLYKYAELKGYDVTASMELDGFVDNAYVNTWSATAMKWAVANGVMSGKTAEDGVSVKLDPQGEATRAECAAMLKAFMTKFAE